jgi:hypothetical protein
MPAVGMRGVHVLVQWCRRKEKNDAERGDLQPPRIGFDEEEDG